MSDHSRLQTVPGLETMPGSERALAQVEVWFASEIIDRVPVRFRAHVERLLRW